MKPIKSGKGTFKSKIPFLYLAVVIAIIFTSYGYAALNTELSISGEAYVKVETDIRVTNIKVLSSENKGYETYNNKYTKDTTSTFVTLPDSNSKLTYEIEITNDSNSRYYLSDILEDSYSNKNVKYEIQDISVGDIIPSNTVKKLKIVFTTNTPNQNTAVVLQYVFKKVKQTEWLYDYTGGEQTFTVPYNGRYKLETWGAQGYSVNSTYFGGYGAYSVGSVQLENNTNLYIYVGQNGPGGYGNFTSYPNGGASYGASPVQGGSGGGSTHILSTKSDLSALKNNLDKILIVSGGGGASTYYKGWNGTGGHAGGYIGGTGTRLTIDIGNYTAGTGGSQTSGGSTGSCGGENGSFGKGGSTSSGIPGTPWGGSGGGGFYGGGGTCGATGGGGSGYIGNSLLTKKAMYCYNCQESNEISTKTISTTCTSATPTANCAKQGNGYAKITFID